MVCLHGCGERVCCVHVCVRWLGVSISVSYCTAEGSRACLSCAVVCALDGVRVCISAPSTRSKTGAHQMSAAWNQSNAQDAGERAGRASRQASLPCVKNASLLCSSLSITPLSCSLSPPARHHRSTSLTQIHTHRSICTHTAVISTADERRRESRLHHTHPPRPTRTHRWWTHPQPSETHTAVMLCP